MRFRKRVKVFPGFYLNFSASGISSTIGVKGASVNFSKRGTYLNTSIPGTGIYDKQKIGGSSAAKHTGTASDVVYDPPKILQGEIKSAALEQLTSASFKELNDTLLEVYTDRIELQKEINKTKTQIVFATIINLIACLLVFGFFIKILKEKIIDIKNYLSDLQQQMESSVIDIDIHFDKAFNSKYDLLVDKYKELLTSKMIWDITSSVNIDRKATRSAATSAVTRMPVTFKLDNINIIRSEHSALHFGNKNGGDLYIYPAFVIITTDQKKFALVDLKDLTIDFSEQRFLEEETVPPDTKIIGTTWAKVNKNGTPDKRFKENYEIPIVRYAQIDVRSASGLNEVYAASNCEAAELFVTALNNYQRFLKN